MKPAIRYVADIAQVREVSIRGTADLNFWREHLHSEGLIPAERDGRAQVLIVAATMKFMGIRFSEVSFSIFVSGKEVGGWNSGAFLVQAFNTSRVFAWCERVLFVTPYLHAGIRISVSSPVSIELTYGRGSVLHAELQIDSTKPERAVLRSGEEAWEGPVFLPKGRRENSGRFFFAKMKGLTTVYSFAPELDTLSITPSPDVAISRALLDSGFTAEEWLVRENACHGKSKTFPRSKLHGPTLAV
jgi:hypothetical protein